MEQYGKFATNYIAGQGAERKDKRKEYRDRITCVPNCDPDNGGPPYGSIAVLIGCIYCFVKYNVNAENGNVFKSLKSSEMMLEPELVGCGRQVSSLFTYSFLHADLGHIVSNMTIMLLVWPLLELAHDSFRPLAVYVFGVMTGALCDLALSPDTNLVGASGGVYALMVAHLAIIIMNWKEMDKKWLTIKSIILAPLLLTAFYDVWKAFLRYGLGKDDFSRVSYAAHLGGTITGLFFGVVILRNYVEDNWERYFRIVSLTVYTGFLIWMYVLATNYDFYCKDLDETKLAGN